MADEIKPYVALVYEDDEGTKLSFSLGDGVTFDITTKLHNWVKHNVGTSAEFMLVGDVSSLGWCICINRDDTNYVSISSALFGFSTKMIKVPPLAGVLFHFGDDVTVGGAGDPFIKADTAACQCEYLILST